MNWLQRRRTIRRMSDTEIVEHECAETQTVLRNVINKAVDQVDGLADLHLITTKCDLCGEWWTIHRSAYGTRFPAPSGLGGCYAVWKSARSKARRRRVEALIEEAQ